MAIWGQTSLLESLSELMNEWVSKWTNCFCSRTEISDSLGVTNYPSVSCSESLPGTWDFESYVRGMTKLDWVDRTVSHTEAWCGECFFSRGRWWDSTKMWTPVTSCHLCFSSGSTYRLQCYIFKQRRWVMLCNRVEDSHPALVILERSPSQGSSLPRWIPHLGNVSRPCKST